MTFSRSRPHPSTRRWTGAAVSFGAAIVIALTLTTAPTWAGSYTVSGTCAWQPWSGSAAIHVYASPDAGYVCPHLSIAAENRSTSGSAGGWTFYAPAGTSIVAAAFNAWADASAGWQAAVYRLGGGASGSSWLNCPGGAGCAANPGNNSASGPGYNATAIVAHLQCNASTSCPYGRALQVAGDATVTLEDNTAPSVNADGPGASPG